MQSKKLCIIPARGGSKRIPRKNIKDFLGKPIIAYSIEAALQSQLFDEIMVSTDDDEIAKVAEEYGAIVPFFRSNETSNDFATTFDVIKEVIREYKALGKDFDYVCCIYACAPFVVSEKLKNSFRLLIEKKYDTIFPVMPFSFPIQRALKQESNTVHYYYPDFALTRSQDLEKSYHDAGQFYWMNMKTCLDKNSILTENTGCITLSELEGQDIDNEVDWKLAELKYELLQSIK
jgi:N-acylneuraminate cytidylyltransferase